MTQETEYICCICLTNFIDDHDWPECPACGSDVVDPVGTMYQHDRNEEPQP